MSEFSTRAEIVTRRTYNRPLNEEGTVFESWADTVGRVIDHQRWLWERAQKNTLFPKQEAELEELRQLMLERKISVSGRTLWLGGTDIAKRRESSQFNCLGREFEFITSNGVRSFQNFKSGDVVDVLTHTGSFQPATVRSYGKQQLYKLTFRRGPRTYSTVRATDNHRWLLSDGSETTKLNLEDKIISAPKFGSDILDDKEWENLSAKQQMYWLYGLVYGDGSLNTASGTTTSRVRLCGDKAQYLDRFIQCGFQYSFPPSCNKDPFVYTGKYLKTLPLLDEENPEDIRAFILGYLAADGAKRYSHDVTKYRTISATGRESIEFLRKSLPVAGFYILGEDDYTGQSTNYGVRGETVRFSIVSDINHTNAHSGWKLVNVEMDEVETVWCLEVKEDHSFVSPAGLVTGNCSFTKVESVFDVVDVLWLLLQGCGVGFSPVIGTLNGFKRPIKDIEVVRSERTDGGGMEVNEEFFEDGVWTIKVGDSAEAWAKSIGKLLAGKYDAEKLVLDFSEIRPAGIRLKGYGWISSGDEAIAEAYIAIAKILNRRAGSLLTRIDILDVVNWLGTILSSRRSAQIALFCVDEPEWQEFAVAKKDWWLTGNKQRVQSNNSLGFNKKPSKKELQHIFDLMMESGGSEPGFINKEVARQRAPWFYGCNPCVSH